jgi:protocatechuate 3,4-dioxygenase alpha subunit
VVFFEGEPGNEADPVLAAVRPAALRSRLVAKREGERYRFDIALRGDGETPFFDD